MLFTDQSCYISDLYIGEHRCALLCYALHLVTLYRTSIEYQIVLRPQPSPGTGGILLSPATTIALGLICRYLAYGQLQEQFRQCRDSHPEQRLKNSWNRVNEKKRQ